MDSALPRKWLAVHVGLRRGRRERVPGAGAGSGCLTRLGRAEGVGPASEQTRTCRAAGYRRTSACVLPKGAWPAADKPWSRPEAAWWITRPGSPPNLAL